MGGVYECIKGVSDCGLKGRKVDVLACFNVTYVGTSQSRKFDS